MSQPRNSLLSNFDVSENYQEESHPLWSVMIPTYNSTEYLRETLLSVLAQDLGIEQMQIMVVDNHSTKDDPEALVKEIGQGRIEFYRQPENIGMMNNFNHCIELARGEFVHILHSDDMIRPGFYESLGKPLQENPELGAAFCRNIFMNERGVWQKISEIEKPESGILPEQWLKNIATVCPIQTPAIVVRRRVYEQIGGFNTDCGLCGDWEMWARIASRYAIWFEVEPLALWRTHSESSTKSNIIDGTYGEYLYHATTTIESYLHLRVPAEIFAQSKQNCAFFALETAKLVLEKNHDTRRAMKHLRSALRYYPSFLTIRSAARIFMFEMTRSLVLQLLD